MMRTYKRTLVRDTMSTSNRHTELMRACVKLDRDHGASWCKDDMKIETLRQIAQVALEAYTEAVGNRAFELEQRLNERVRY